MAYNRRTWVDGTTPLSAANMNVIEKGIADAHDLIAAMWSSIYPVGCYFETSDSSFNPSAAWGGTWVKEIAGQVHVSAGTGYPVLGALSNTSDGGSKDAIIPYHNHSIPALPGTAEQSGNHSHSVSVTSESAGAHTHSVSGTAASAGGHTHSVSGSAGTAGNHYHQYVYTGQTAFSESGSDTSHYAASPQSWENTTWSGDHTHTVSVTCGSAGSHTHSVSVGCASAGGHSHNINASCASEGAHTHTISTSASSTGTVGSSGNTTNANMMPHINVYRWHRIA